MRTPTYDKHMQTVATVRAHDPLLFCACHERAGIILHHEDGGILGACGPCATILLDMPASPWDVEAKKVSKDC